MGWRCFGCFATPHKNCDDEYPDSSEYQSPTYYPECGFRNGDSPKTACHSAEVAEVAKASVSVSRVDPKEEDERAYHQCSRTASQFAALCLTSEALSNSLFIWYIKSSSFPCHLKARGPELLTRSPCSRSISRHTSSYFGRSRSVRKTDSPVRTAGKEVH